MILNLMIFLRFLERVLCAINVAPAITSLVSTDHRNIPIPALCARALRTRWDISRSGHTAHKRAVHWLNPQQRGVSLEYQESSIEPYSSDWLPEFVLSARGMSPEAALNAPKSRCVAIPSALGEAGGGAMFCRKNTWEAANFPRNLFCELVHSPSASLIWFEQIMIAVFIDAGSSADESPGSETDLGVVEVKMDQDDALGTRILALTTLRLRRGALFLDQGSLLSSTWVSLLCGERLLIAKSIK
ncbi:hypothetical protein EI94DRAFT_1805228 [Lactarius quietus]|nr:hypothetical protein EI94DRAFT_1805228 [Lactarius quietus]